MGVLETMGCELMLCYNLVLAGGCFHDVSRTGFLSKPSFYHLVWHTIHRISMCKTLAIKLPYCDQFHFILDGFKKIFLQWCIEWLHWSLILVVRGLSIVEVHPIQRCLPLQLGSGGAGSSQSIRYTLYQMDHIKVIYRAPYISNIVSNPRQSLI